MASTGGDCLRSSAAAVVRMSVSIRNTGAGIDAYAWTEGGAWWEVAVPEVSSRPQVQAARQEYDKDKQSQKASYGSSV